MHLAGNINPMLQCLQHHTLGEYPRPDTQIRYGLICSVGFFVLECRQ